MAAITSEQRSRLLHLAGYSCSYCQAELLLATMVIDHFVPKLLGGSNSESNLMVACWRCNSIKGALHPDQLTQGMFTRLEPPCEPPWLLRRRLLQEGKLNDWLSPQVPAGTLPAGMGEGARAVLPSRRSEEQSYQAQLEADLRRWGC